MLEKLVSMRTQVLISSVLISVFALLPSSAMAQSAAPASSCFEILPAMPNVVPTSPILLNKCTGSTHVLRRVERGKGRVGYEWLPIEMQEAQQAPERPAKTSSGRKCFSFDGRQFCE